MAIVIKNFNEIVLDIIAAIRATQPTLDVKIGSITRDVDIDPVADQLAFLYEQVQNTSYLSSIETATGDSLDGLAANYGITRLVATKAIGTVYFTMATLDDTELFIVPAGTLITTSGPDAYSFQTINDLTVSGANKADYYNLALFLAEDLATAGITDKYVVAADVIATVAGSASNVASFTIVTINFSGIDNVMNNSAFVDGTDQEADAELRERIKLAFAGSNKGTAAGYEATAREVLGVLDALVVGPGDPLMIRDGGNGGKADIYIVGKDAVQVEDVIIFSILNSLVYPFYVFDHQPVNSISSVTGSISGLISTALYQLVKDSSFYDGSEQATDALQFLPPLVDSVIGGEVTKGVSGGADVVHTNIVGITKVSQHKIIENGFVEISNIGVDPFYIKIPNYPLVSITEIRHRTLGIKYSVVSLNEEAGEVKIAGSVAPTTEFDLEADYIYDNQYIEDKDWRHVVGTETVDWSLDPITFTEQAVIDSTYPWKLTVSQTNLNSVTAAKNYSAAVAAEEVPVGVYQFNLGHVKISNAAGTGLGSVGNSSAVFSDLTVFATEVAIEPANPGEYRIIYGTGIVNTFSPTVASITVNYKYEEDYDLTSVQIVSGGGYFILDEEVNATPKPEPQVFDYIMVTYTVDGREPSAGSTYLVDYSFAAPIEGEQLTIVYSYNKLVTTVQEAVDAERIVTADLMVFEGTAVPITVKMIVTVLSGYDGTAVASSIETVLTNAIVTNELGVAIEVSDLLEAAYTVAGIDKIDTSRVDNTPFSVVTVTRPGQVGAQDIQLSAAEYATAGNILIIIA